MKTFLAALCLSAMLLFSQGISRIDGVVTDPSGAAVPGAEIVATAVATSQVLKTSSDEKGQWSIVQLDAGVYRVTVTKPGFKVATANNVSVTAGEPTNVPTKLEVGQATETVTVQSGAEIVQAASAEVSNTLTGRQITELPFATRNAVELLVTQPGTSTPTNPRSSTINGLPKGAINITIDGINTQDNELKSSDGFFSYIMPSVDSLEEVTLTTSAAGADSTAQGAAQIKFVTKSGTNQFHGGGFYQIRNTFFNSNYYFNNEILPTTANNFKGLPRDILHLRQDGGHIGGPIVKDKLFFFGNYERFRNPASNSFSQNIANPGGGYANGLYSYQTTTGAINTVNLLQIAGSGNSALPSGTRAFPTTVDPIVGATYAQVAAISAGAPLISNAGTGGFNDSTWNYQLSGLDARDFWTARFDYNVTQKHHLSFTYDYDKYVSVPDFLNGIVPVYPGAGAVLGSNVSTGQRSNRFVGTLALRSAISSRLTNELRAGLNGGTVLFFDAINDGMFQPWRGYRVSLNDVHITTTSSPQRRNGPYKEVGDTISYVKGAHQISGGFTWSQVSLWQQLFGTESIPSITFNAATGDPLSTGASAPFNIAANFPGASSTQISNMLTAYSQLVGRVSSISTRQVLNESTHQYSFNTPALDRDSEQWWGLFAQDVWRVAPSVTITAGLRWEKEGTWRNTDHLYSNASNAAVWGLSGVGNLFNPGVMNGVVPTYTQLTDSNTYNMPGIWAPSVGIAWQLPAREGLLGVLFGHHAGASVLRAGYSISTTREGSNVFQATYTSNTGLTQDASVSNAISPTDFGPVGSVLFRDPTLPVRSGLPTTENFPIAANFTSQVAGFDPNLKMGYIQSWNIGFQRELSRNTVIEARYTGNHGVHEWRLMFLNEVNTVENGFTTEFNNARQNLLIARGGNMYSTSTNNFANQGLPGQVNLPFLQAALGTTCCNTASLASNLALGQVGSMASSISSTQSFNTNFINAKYPANYFVVNPTIAGGSNFDVLNTGSSYYDSGQVELRRRLAAGLQFQLNYSFSKSLADGATSNSVAQANATTLRDLRMDKLPDGFDIRHAIKANYIYELPLGPGRHFFSGVSNKLAKKALEGWEIAGVARLQSGTPLFWGGFGTVNANSSGVVLHNITNKQLQDMVNITKTQNPVSPYVPSVYYLPVPVAPTGLTSANNTNFITNTQAAFNVNNLTPAQVDPSAPYLGPASPGQWGCKCYIYENWQRHIDVSLIKVTHLRESVTLEFRAQALNVFNLTNFLPGSGNTSTTFGQVTSAYRDISGTYDPGGRILEFVARVNF
jgi:Carboxypeptidase regulatory-like domain